MLLKSNCGAPLLGLTKYIKIYYDLQSEQEVAPHYSTPLDKSNRCVFQHDQNNRCQFEPLGNKL